MAQSICEIMWIRQLLMEVGKKISIPSKLLSDNQATMYITSNTIFHERTKYNEIDCHFVYEKIQLEFIYTIYIKTR